MDTRFGTDSAQGGVQQGDRERPAWNGSGRNDSAEHVLGDFSRTPDCPRFPLDAAGSRQSRYEFPNRSVMPHIVDFNTVSTAGLESSPVAPALAGLRANEARYFKNKYDHVFAVEPASKAKAPLEATSFQVENIRMAYVFYESGLSINVMYAIDDPKKRAVGFKLSDGMEIPSELASRFKFAKQKSKLAGTIRGSFFVIKGQY